MTHTDPVSITMTRIQWARIYATIIKSDDPTPTARTLAYRINDALGITSPAEGTDVNADAADV